MSGPKGSGSAYLVALREDGGAWTLRRLDLELDKTTELMPEEFANKRMVVFDRARHGPVDNVISDKPTSV